jgi:hypothetical protein
LAAKTRATNFTAKAAAILTEVNKKAKRNYFQAI